MSNPEEESNPLLNDPDIQQKPDQKAAPSNKTTTPSHPSEEAVKKWTAQGLPLANGTVVGFEPLPRQQWDSNLFACLGRSDEFCGSDFEVCLLGSFAPCVLYGSNVERLGLGPGSFANSCLPYAGLYMLGNTFVGGNCIAPWLSYPSRTAIRRRFNLEGTFEAIARMFGCSSLVADEEKREQLEAACDFATHFLCHSCSLCQEGRELRRRLPHPGFNVVMMMPPMDQAMSRAN